MQRLIAFGLILMTGSSIAGTAPMPEIPHASSLQADFTQTHYLPALSKPLITHGQISIDQSGFTWQVNVPYQYTYRMHDGKMIEIDAQGRKKVITAKEAPWIIPIKNLFTALLSADTKKLESLFLLTVKTTENGTILSMTPRSEAMKKAIIRIKVLHSPWPEKITIWENGGGKLNITLDITHLEPAKESQP